MTTLGKIIALALQHGVEFPTQGGTAAIEASLNGASSVSGLADLQALTRYVLRTNPNSEESLLEAYKILTGSQRQLQSGITATADDQNLEREIEALFHVDMSGLSVEAKQTLKQFYFCHAIDADAQEKMRSWLRGLVLCQSQSHITNIESLLTLANEDISGIASRVLRKLLSISANSGSYELERDDSSFAFHHLPTETSLIVIEDPETLPPQVDQHLKKAKDRRHKIEFSLRSRQPARQSVTTPFGSYPVNNQFCVEARGPGTVRQNIMPKVLTGAQIFLKR